MFLLVSVRHVGAHPGGHQHGVSIQISINLGKTFFRISHIRNILLAWILARGFVYLPPFISQIPEFIYWMVLTFILIYFEWRDTENQQLIIGLHFVIPPFLIFQFCDVSLNNFLILCVWNKLASWTKGPCLQQGGKMKNFCLEQGQGLKASMAYHHPNFLSPGDFIRLQFLWEKLIKGLPLL